MNELYFSNFSNSKNPYYAYIELSIGNFYINNESNGAISMQATYKTDSFCTFVVEVYDDTANELADAVMNYGDVVHISYGYTDSDEKIVAMNCKITEIHTELIGTGEIMTLELIPEKLHTAILPIDGTHVKDEKLYGSPSDVLRQIIDRIGWQEGLIVETRDIRGTGNGNDDPDNPQNYYYWGANMLVTDLLKTITTEASTTDSEPKGDFILYTDFSTDKPTVYFYPSEQAPEAASFEWVYGREETEIISLSVDWGQALRGHIGTEGSTAKVQDDTRNKVSDTSQELGYREESVTNAKSINVEYNGNVLTKSLGKIQGPQGEETYYGTLELGSPAFTYTITENPNSGMAAWKRYYREDGVLMWGEYVVVAADISGDYGEEGTPGTSGYYPALPDHVGKFKRGDIVETSLGKGIVVDACRAACDVDYDKFDIAVDKAAFNDNPIRAQVDGNTELGDLGTDSLRKERLAGIKNGFIETGLKASVQTNGSTSEDKAKAAEEKRLNDLFNSVYEATLVIKGRIDINVTNKIYLTVYRKDGKPHFSSGRYMVEGRVDSIEGQFTTTLKLLKETGDISINGKLYDFNMNYTGVNRTVASLGTKVSIIHGEATGVEVINEARNYIGNPYVWGGSSLTNGCDCSHFVWLVLKNVGSDYGYRTSAYWRNVGDEVPRNEVRAGDVMCYNGHVAFYVNSHSIIHARGKKYGIEETSCDPFSYHGGVLTIRRVVDGKKVIVKPDNEEDR